jgi:hypothetical protein
MNRRRNQLYLAHSCPPEPVFETESDADDCAGGIKPEEAAEYIASLLGSLRDIAANARLRLLSDLLSVAEEEARLNSRA